MWIPDEQISNVAVALAKYSEWLNDNEIKEPGIIREPWELTRREVWDLRSRIKEYWASQQRQDLQEWFQQHPGYNDVHKKIIQEIEENPPKPFTSQYQNKQK